MMKLVIDFFLEYWTIIVPCLLGVIEFILILIFKKRPKVIDNSLAEYVIQCCKLAEEEFGKGQGKQKLAMVLNQCKDKLGLSFIYFKPYILKTIETILECQSK